MSTLVVFTPGQLAQLVATFGPDHVLMGTDYPFDMAEADPLGHIAAVPEFDAATRAAIAGGNAARLLRPLNAPARGRSARQEIQGRRLGEQPSPARVPGARRRIVCSSAAPPVSMQAPSSCPCRTTRSPSGRRSAS